VLVESDSRQVTTYIYIVIGMGHDEQQVGFVAIVGRRQDGGLNLRCRNTHNEQETENGKQQPKHHIDSNSFTGF
jgi:hypothetical protein